MKILTSKEFVECSDFIYYNYNSSNPIKIKEQYVLAFLGTNYQEWMIDLYIKALHETLYSR